MDTRDGDLDVLRRDGPSLFLSGWDLNPDFTRQPNKQIQRNCHHPAKRKVTMTSKACKTSDNTGAVNERVCA